MAEEEPNPENTIAEEEPKPKTYAREMLDNYNVYLPSFRFVFIMFDPSLDGAVEDVETVERFFLDVCKVPKENFFTCNLATENLTVEDVEDFINKILKAYATGTLGGQMTFYYRGRATLDIHGLIRGCLRDETFGLEMAFCGEKSQPTETGALVIFDCDRIESQQINVTKFPFNNKYKNTWVADHLKDHGIEIKKSFDRGLRDNRSVQIRIGIGYLYTNRRNQPSEQKAKISEFFDVVKSSGGIFPDGVHGWLVKQKSFEFGDNLKRNIALFDTSEKIYHTPILVNEMVKINRIHTLIFGVSDYSKSTYKCIETSEDHTFDNLGSSNNDVVEVEKLFKDQEWTESHQITSLLYNKDSESPEDFENSVKKEFENLFTIAEDDKRTEPVLFIVYCSGHGFYDKGVQFAAPSGKLMYLNNSLNSLSQNKNVYVIAITDCCMELWKTKYEFPGKVSLPQDSDGVAPGKICWIHATIPNTSALMASAKTPSVFTGLFLKKYNNFSSLISVIKRDNERYNYSINYDYIDVGLDFQVTVKEDTEVTE